MKSLSTLLAAIVVMVTTFGMHVSNPITSKHLSRFQEVAERKES